MIQNDPSENIYHYNENIDESEAERIILEICPIISKLHKRIINHFK